MICILKPTETVLSWKILEFPRRGGLGMGVFSLNYGNFGNVPLFFNTKSMIKLIIIIINNATSKAFVKKICASFWFSFSPISSTFILGSKLTRIKYVMDKEDIKCTKNKCYGNITSI